MWVAWLRLTAAQSYHRRVSAAADTFLRRTSTNGRDVKSSIAKCCNECSGRKKRAVGHILQLDGESADPRRMHSTLEFPQPLFALEGHDVIDNTKVVA